MVMQSREDMMEELYEQMEAEGMSREEAEAFMNAVGDKGGEDAGGEFGDGYGADGVPIVEPEGGEL